ncbi:MAG: retron St85 family effector protein [Parvibaculum sp.]
MKLLESYLAQIEQQELQVKQFPDFVFLCGGPINDKADECKYSVRQFILDRLFTSSPSLARRVVLAEQINDWYKDAHFGDLLDFENHLSHLAHTVVLVLESPGAIAELGAFALMPSIAEKLFVLMNGEYAQSNSFIELGPIKFLRDRHDLVYIYPWGSEKNPVGGPHWIPKTEDVEAILEQVISDLKTHLEKGRRTATFSGSDPGHVTLLVCELLSIATTLKLGEIEAALKSLGIRASTKEVRRHLFASEKLGLVERFEYGHEPFYFGTRQSGFIKFRLKDGADSWMKDRSRVVVEIANAHREGGTRHWNAISLYRKGKKRGMAL